MSSRRSFGALLAILGFALALALSCSAGKGTKPSPSGSSSSAPVVDSELLAYLSLARALHHEANLDEAENKTDHAIRTLERLVAAKRPGAAFPEVGEVLADTHARLAELRLRSGALDAALADVRSGRAEVAKGSYFDGHLFEVEGMIEEARSVGLADAGKVEAAREARDLARARLREAVRIQETVIERALSDAGRGDVRVRQ